MRRTKFCMSYLKAKATHIRDDTVDKFKNLISLYVFEY